MINFSQGIMILLGIQRYTQRINPISVINVINLSQGKMILLGIQRYTQGLNHLHVVIVTNLSQIEVN